MVTEVTRESTHVEIQRAVDAIIDAIQPLYRIQPKWEEPKLGKYSKLRIRNVFGTILEILMDGALVIPRDEESPVFDESSDYAALSALAHWAVWHECVGEMKMLVTDEMSEETRDLVRVALVASSLALASIGTIVIPKEVEDGGDTSSVSSEERKREEALQDWLS